MSKEYNLTDRDSAKAGTAYVKQQRKGIRRPGSALEWIMWAIVVLFLLYLVVRMFLPWWYAPVPTSPPPVAP